MIIYKLVLILALAIFTVLLFIIGKINIFESIVIALLILLVMELISVKDDLYYLYDIDNKLNNKLIEDKESYVITKGCISNYKYKGEIK